MKFFRNLLVKLCEFLEKKLYDEPTYSELSKELDRTKYCLEQALAQIDYVYTRIRNNEI